MSSPGWSKLAVVLPGLAMGAGVLWYRLHDVRAPEPEQPASGMTIPTPSASTVVGTAAPAPPLPSRSTVTAARPRSVNSAPTLEARAKIAGARKEIEELYPTLVAQLDLTAEEGDQFFDLLARQQVRIDELNDARYTPTLEQADEGEQSAMLGGKYAQWQEYQENESQRDPIDRLHNALIAQGNNMSDDLNPMIDALAAEQKNLTNELMRAPQAKGLEPRELLQLQVQRAAADNRRLVEAAARYLRPQQLEVYERLLRQRDGSARRKLRAMELELDE